MSRNSWIMFGMVAIVLISIVLVALLILVPQSEPIADLSLEEYENIDPSDYSYTQSKDITKEAMKETYSVTTEDVKEGKASKLYKQGNTDPFAEVQSSTNNSSNGTTNNNTNNNTTTSSNNANGTTNSNSSSASGNGSSSNNAERPVSAEDK